MGAGFLTVGDFPAMLRSLAAAVENAQALADAPLAEALAVHRAPLEPPEAELERVVQVVQVEVLGTPGVGSVDERTVVLFVFPVGHERDRGARVR
jgi:hypothetical protein